MNPEEPVRDIMRRTMFNLRLIEQQATTSGPYEVTQLINSFLGALAHPWERFKKELRTHSIKSAECAGWPCIQKERPSDTNPRHLGDLLRLMRNGIAHGNITFLPDQDGEIRAIRLWNADPRSGRQTWGAIVNVEDMRQLLDRFVQLAEELHEQQHVQGE